MVAQSERKAGGPLPGIPITCNLLRCSEPKSQWPLPASEEQRLDYSMVDSCYLDAGLTEGTQSVTVTEGQHPPFQVRRFCFILEQLSGSELCIGSAQEGPNLVRFSGDLISIRTYDPRDDDSLLGTRRSDKTSLATRWPSETTVIPFSKRPRSKFIESCRTSAIK